MKNNRIFTRCVAVFAAAALCLVPLAGCTQNEIRVEDPVLECEEGAIPLSFYEFLLSRMKGTLARNKYNVTDPEFWSTAVEGTEHTYESYYNEAILENCKTYLAASVLFDREGLELSESTLASIDEEVDFYIDYDGGDDPDKFNTLMAKYGVDAESLREAYILEAKYEYLLNHLYGSGSLIADTVKQEYYEENYFRFKQILFPSFYYEYERDSQGNVIYFDTETGEPIYDRTNGVYVYDINGNRVKDDYGNTVYYDTEGNILYDTVSGEPSVVVDENGEGVKIYYTSAEMEESMQRASELAVSFGKGNYSAFEAEQAKHTLIEGVEDAYPDGYYLSRIESAGYEDYLLDILTLLEEMEVGEVRMLESDYGYHVIMKYALDRGKFSDGEYAEWFTGFDDALINKLFLDKCAEILPEITVNAENLSKARSIRQIGTNYDY